MLFLILQYVIIMSVKDRLHFKKCVALKQALKVDVDGCKKVIEARKNKVSMVSCIPFLLFVAV